MDPRKGLRPKVSLVKADDVPRTAPNRAEKRRLLKALRRLPAARTGRPWPLQRATGRPEWLVDARLAHLLMDWPEAVMHEDQPPEALCATPLAD